MITETTYNESDLHKGECSSCGDRTLITDNGKCPECIEAIKFEEATMSGLGDY